MHTTKKHHCPTCGGDGYVWTHDEPWPDTCPSCEDDWCRLRSCSNQMLERHLVGDCRHARKVA